MKYLLPLIFLILVAVSFHSSYAYNQLTGPTNFTGTTTNLGQANLSFNKTTAFSMQFQMMRGTVISNECIVCKLQTSFTGSTGWGLWTDGQLVNFQMTGTSGDSIRVRSGILLNNNHLQNMLIIYNGNGSAKGVSFYVNGTKIITSMLADNLVSSSTNNLNIMLGSMSDSTFKFTGQIYNMKIYSGLYSNESQNYVKSLNENMLLSSNVMTQKSGDNKPIICGDGYNTSYFGVDNCGQYKFLGIGTKYADDPLVIDGRMYLNPPSQPVDTRITIVGVHNGTNPDGSQHCLSEGIMFADNLNVPINRNNELYNMYYDNCGHTLYLGSYTPLGNNDFAFHTDMSIDANGNINILRGHLYVQGQLVK